jgi:hypothetical protein
MFSLRRLVRLVMRRARSNVASVTSAGLVLLLAITGVVYGAGAQEFPISDVETDAAQPPTPEAATAYWEQVRELRKTALSLLTRHRRLWTAVNPASLKGRAWT